MFKNLAIVKNAQEPAHRENDTNVVSACAQNLKTFEIEGRVETYCKLAEQNMILRGTLGTAGPHKSDLRS